MVFGMRRFVDDHQHVVDVDVRQHSSTWVSVSTAASVELFGTVPTGVTMASCVSDLYDSVMPAADQDRDLAPCRRRRTVRLGGHLRLRKPRRRVHAERSSIERAAARSDSDVDIAVRPRGARVLLPEDRVTLMLALEQALDVPRKLTCSCFLTPVRSSPWRRFGAICCSAPTPSIRR